MIPMVLITQDGDVYNFDNVVAVWRQGKYIHAKSTHGLDYPLAKYDTEERTKEVMENFVSELNDTPFTMATRYAFPTE